MIETKVLSVKARELFLKLSNFKDNFYLAGGTGLALQIGHRVSVDFDLFSDSPIKKTLLQKIEGIFKDSSLEIRVNNSRELTVIIDGVKFTFLHYPFCTILPLVKLDPIPLLSIKETIAGKAYTIGRRGELKDYIDVYICLKDGHVTLHEIVDLATKKFSGVFDPRLFLEQLVYLDDVTEVDITMVSGTSPSKKELFEYFSRIISQSNFI